MSFTFNPKEMEEDLRILSRAAGAFLAPRASQGLEQLARDIQIAVAAAATTTNQKFTWRTAPETPIKILSSRHWKGDPSNPSISYNPIFAEVTIDYSCTYIAEAKRVYVDGGVTVVKLKREDNPDSGEKVFHFDAGEGGWENSAGHPPMHLQFYGTINDIPRLPSLIVHPVDVISFTILELHQHKWRDYIKQFKPRSDFRKLPARQRERLHSIAGKLRDSLGDTSDHGLVILQRRMLEPLQL